MPILKPSRQVLAQQMLAFFESLPLSSRVVSLENNGGQTMYESEYDGDEDEGNH